jgi:hypothetical protein
MAAIVLCRPFLHWHRPIQAPQYVSSCRHASILFINFPNKLWDSAEDVRSWDDSAARDIWDQFMTSPTWRAENAITAAPFWVYEYWVQGRKRALRNAGKPVSSADVSTTRDSQRVDHPGSNRGASYPAPSLVDKETADLKLLDLECQLDAETAQRTAAERAAMTGLPRCGVWGSNRRHACHDLRTALTALGAGFPDTYTDVGYFNALWEYVNDPQATASGRWPTVAACKKANDALGVHKHGTKAHLQRSLRWAVNNCDYTAPVKKKRKVHPDVDMNGTSASSDSGGDVVHAANLVRAPRIRHGVSLPYQDYSSLHKNIYVDFGEDDVADEFEEAYENTQFAVKNIQPRLEPHTVTEATAVAGVYQPMSTEQVTNVLRNSASSLATSVIAEAARFDDTHLDATQRLVPQIVQNALDTDTPLRMLLLGTAGPPL